MIEINNNNQSTVSNQSFQNLPSANQMSPNGKSRLWGFLATAVLALPSAEDIVKQNFKPQDYDGARNILVALLDSRAKEVIPNDDNLRVPTKAELKIIAHLKEVSKRAFLGDVDGVEFCVQKALDEAQQLDIKITDEQKKDIKELIKLAKVNRVLNNLDKAIRLAAFGRAAEAEILLSETLENAQKKGIELTEEQQELAKIIPQEANKNAIDVNLYKAQQLAKDGEVDSVGGLIATVYRNAKKAQVELTEEQKKTIKTVFEEAVDIALKEVFQHASLGDAYRVEILVSKIKNCFQQTGIEFSLEQKKTIQNYLKLAHRNAIDVNLGKAEEKLKSGYIDEIGIFISIAYDHAEKAEVVLTSEQKDKIKKVFYGVVDIVLTKASEHASRGEHYWVEMLVSQVESNAQRAKLELAQETKKDMKEFIRLANLNAIARNLAEAKESAEAGVTSMAEMFISNARENFKKANLKPTKEEEKLMENIIRLAHEKAIPRNLAKAKELAEAGDVGMVEIITSTILDKLKKANLEPDNKLQKEIEAILILAHTNGVDVNLSKALERAKKGDVQGAMLFLSFARKNAEKVEIKFNEKQEKIVETINKLLNIY
ncbi:MAG TPA: hypothetical protein PKD37_07535 [Oligoflexia bacterium]|nr:hypothetical protein [Oligoflexia bacterium]HMP27814.1 hypothetical protein [Oligoflexia bacterium]